MKCLYGRMVGHWYTKKRPVFDGRKKKLFRKEKKKYHTRKKVSKYIRLQINYILYVYESLKRQHCETRQVYLCEIIVLFIKTNYIFTCFFIICPPTVFFKDFPNFLHRL